MPKVEERVIGGRTFRVHQLPFGQSRDLLVLLGQVLGPGLSGIASGSGGGDLDGVSGLGALAVGIGGVLERLTPAALDRVQGVLAQKTFVTMEDGRSPLLADAKLEVVFDGRLEDYFAWLRFALEVNYASFFGALKTAFMAWLEGRRAKVTATATSSASSSPLGSTGTFTESRAAGDTGMA